MKILNTIITALLILFSGSLFANEKPSAKEIKLPEMVWGSADDLYVQIEKNHNITLPGIEWGSPQDAELIITEPSMNNIKLPEIVWGNPDEAESVQQIHPVCTKNSTKNK